MDARTVDFYDSHAAEMAEKYNQVESPLKSTLPRILKAGNKVLDIGCGSGRDAAMLLAMGFDARGLEPSRGLREQAVLSYPELKGRIHAGGLPDIPDDLPVPFDCILMSAVIMHIDDGVLVPSIPRIAPLLTPGGILIISHCTRRDVGLNLDREENGRLFVLRSSEKIVELFKDYGLGLKSMSGNADKLGREGIEWETVVLEAGGEIKKISHGLARIENL